MSRAHPTDAFAMGRSSKCSREMARQSMSRTFATPRSFAWLRGYRPRAARRGHLDDAPPHSRTRRERDDDAVSGGLGLSCLRLAFRPARAMRASEGRAERRAERRSSTAPLLAVCCLHDHRGPPHCAPHRSSRALMECVIVAVVHDTLEGIGLNAAASVW